jgi:hypothetical protein
MIPSFFIIPLFLAAFVLTIWQYVEIDSRWRILNIRFAVMVCSIVCAFAYPLHMYYYPYDRHGSWAFLAAGLFLLGSAYYLLRHMPPRDIQ